MFALFVMFISDNMVDESQLNRLSKSAARFVLQTKEKYQLTQTAMQGIIHGVTCLMQVIQEEIQHKNSLKNYTTLLGKYEALTH